MCLQSPVVGRSQGQQQEKKQFDLLSDLLGSDIFAAPAPQSTATANFANFAHFNSHAGMSFPDNFAQDMCKSPRNINCLLSLFTYEHHTVQTYNHGTFRGTSQIGLYVAQAGLEFALC